MCAHAYLLSTKHRTFTSPQKVPFCPFPGNIPRINGNSDFCLHGLDLPLLELRKNEILQCILFCIWLPWLSVLHLKFTHTVVSVNDSEFLLLSSIPSYERATVCPSFLLLTGVLLVPSADTVSDRSSWGLSLG